MIIDTNVYSALQRAEPALLRLVATSSRVALPLPVVAELKSGFIKGSLTERNMQRFTAFLAGPEVSLLLPGPDAAVRYAELQALCWRQGRALSNNDIWIAALAQEDGDLLVTYDRDFMVFGDVFGDKLVMLSGTNPVQ